MWFVSDAVLQRMFAIRFAQPEGLKVQQPRASPWVRSIKSMQPVGLQEGLV
jgi:hypothetical protein